ncbi:transposase [Desulfococcaceae bacterium HSG7]|nr:transposase [Desulfococcaceae bacterium HSG7]
MADAQKEKNQWKFFEFSFRCRSWERFFRAFYTKFVNNGNRPVSDFAGSDNVILTNISINSKIFENCLPQTVERLLNPCTIIERYHQCGTDELAHRGFKDFGSEKLPFERFGPDSAFFYFMAISFFLFQTIKEDVPDGVVPITAYATTVRRRIIDIAAKIVKTGRQIILKISKTDMKFLNFSVLWEKCQSPPPIPA